MKPTYLSRLFWIDRVQCVMVIALGLTVMTVMCVVSASLTADEPSDPEADQTPQVESAFDPETMPSAEQLLTKNLLGSQRWTAKISISGSSDDSAATGSLSGSLIRNDAGLAGTLAPENDTDRRLHLALTENRASAWTSPGDKADNASLEHLIRGIYLLELFVGLPDQTMTLAETIKAYRLTNLGLSNVRGARCYVIEAKPAAGSTQPPRISSLEAERFLITVAADDFAPRQVMAILPDRSRLALMLASIVTDQAEQQAQAVSEPPQDSFVIDLSGKSSTGEDLKNPVPYTAESIKRGKLLYIADCEVCHSVDGTGRDSDVTDNAADLTSTEFWLSDGSEAATFLAIRDGAGEEMPGYKDEYRDEKMIWDLVNYIRSLQQ